MSSGDKKWQGYSAYKEVASQLHKDVNHAIKAFAHVQSLDSQNVGVTPQTAVKTKRAMLGISKRMYHEIHVNQHIEGFKDIYARWSGNEVDEDGEIVETKDPGFVQDLEDADFTNGVPDFMSQMMEDLITATWKLGYIRAGVEKPADPDDTETEVEEMFE